MFFALSSKSFARADAFPLTEAILHTGVVEAALALARAASYITSLVTTALFVISESSEQMLQPH